MERSKLVLAPDSFKQSLTAPEVCQCLEQGLRQTLRESWEIVSLPQADGGEGTVRALVEARDGEYTQVTVEDPLGRPVEATYGILETTAGTTAVIEMAQASGLELLDDSERDPTQTTTRGTGQLIRHAMEAGCERILLGLGGSATCDGGMGLARGLGYRLYDRDGELLSGRGDQLSRLDSIEPPEDVQELRKLDVLVASDVDNPLLGPEGASRVYAPQKGATDQQVELLEQGMVRYADRVEQHFGREVRDREGAGAAGGLGFGLMIWLDAWLQPGAKLVADYTGFSEVVSETDVVITGEGRIDSQTLHGKSPWTVAGLARDHGVSVVIGIAGALGTGYRQLYERFDLLVGLARGPMSETESIQRAERLLQDWGEDFGRVIESTRLLAGS